MSIKISLIDTDYVVRTKTDLGRKKVKEDKLGKFLREIEEELMLGTTGYLQVEGLKKDPVTFEISKLE